MECCCITLSAMETSTCKTWILLEKKELTTQSSFSKMFESVSCHVAKLIDPAQAANQIDDAIRECYIQSRPVYIALPTDMVEKKVDGARLKTKLDLKYPENKKEQEDYAVEQVLKHLHAAKNPVILVDACTIRHRVRLTASSPQATQRTTLTFPTGAGRGTRIHQQVWPSHLCNSNGQRRRR